MLVWIDTERNHMLGTATDLLCVHFDYANGGVHLRRYEILQHDHDLSVWPIRRSKHDERLGYLWLRAAADYLHTVDRDRLILVHVGHGNANSLCDDNLPKRPLWLAIGRVRQLEYDQLRFCGPNLHADFVVIFHGVRDGFYWNQNYYERHDLPRKCSVQQYEY